MRGTSSIRQNPSVVTTTIYVQCDLLAPTISAKLPCGMAMSASMPEALRPPKLCSGNSKGCPNSPIAMAKILWGGISHSFLLQYSRLASWAGLPTRATARCPRKQACPYATMHACTSARKHPRMPGKRNQAQHKHQPHGATKTLARGHQQGTNQGSARPNATDGRNALGVEKLHGRGALRACPSLILLFNEQLGPSIAPCISRGAA